MLCIVGCEVDLSEGYSVIESPGHLVHPYPNQLECTWTIIDTKHRPLTLMFHSFVTERKQDVLKVFLSLNILRKGVVKLYCDFYLLYNGCRKTVTVLRPKNNMFLRHRPHHFQPPNQKFLLHFQYSH